MPTQKVPVKHYQELAKNFPGVMAALENMGVAIREAGPITEKTAELIQLAGAAAAQMEGSVHSHTRRALQAGAVPAEIYQTLLLLISTIGFPKVSAAITWAQDILKKKNIRPAKKK
ncbi:MAG: carboxymuconolactone decarboxylase family protein [Deltaproteobacteria bacterium]|nr:carboxymuconolactone decarboxylase family protein [Deltaproteobacteria bacterium]